MVLPSPNSYIYILDEVINCYWYILSTQSRSEKGENAQVLCTQYIPIIC
jgi:hypothetical protein